MGIITALKRAFYFPVASYFKLFAAIRLLTWHPRVIVITGSSGKTTTMHLVKSQLGNVARYSEKANSAFGIPFDILGLKRQTLKLSEWPALFIEAPINAFKSPYKENIYIVEADCDRPGEGEFLASLLRPEVTIWLSLSRSHSMNFEEEKGTLEEAIAREFSQFIKYTQSLAVINADNPLILKEAGNKKNIEKISANSLIKYEVYANKTIFIFKNSNYSIPFLLPEETAYSIQALEKLMNYLQLPIDSSFPRLSLPPGRSTLFKGIKGITIIDSSYNASLESMSALLHAYDKYPASKKWVVLGDMIEQGGFEKEEHEKLALIVAKLKLEKIILVGPRVSKFVYPKLMGYFKSPGTVVHFDLPSDALSYLHKNIEGKETILFKGARFLEGIIEHLLEDRKDIEKLCRRERVWEERRKKWGL